MKETNSTQQPTAFRDRADVVVNHPFFTAAVMVLILINAIIVGLETYPAILQKYHTLLGIADRILLWLFTIEIVLRLIVAKPTLSYFKDPWNLFDFTIVSAGHLFAGASFVTVLRILRVLRLLRTISIIPSLRRVVNALLLTIPALGNIMLLLGLIFYIFAVVGTMLFSKLEPELFGTLHDTLLTLFQLVTLDSWSSGVMRPMLEQAPWAWIYFITFILVGSFVIINLFIGVIVSNVEKANEAERAQLFEKEDVIDVKVTSVNHELTALRNEVRELKALLVKINTNHTRKD
ncbi:ion transporter [Bacillus horti]|uniref:Voltage-gated sodium channel n=1 Tax=Caldalkalibacillus horti TaxID=77523 RepID=A0ABT9VVS6_9BACI|nr:ion transporter [Bacillus horti]MDQ0165078.1 voltage-gated sodium channel [Bacillus horti]